MNKNQVLRETLSFIRGFIIMTLGALVINFAIDHHVSQYLSKTCKAEDIHTDHKNSDSTGLGVLDPKAE